MSETTPRLGLPLLQAGQAQKEITHNEAISLVDHLLCPSTDEGPRNDPPMTPEPGASWIVGPSPTGAWAGHAGAVVCATEGGWRFIAARDGMVVWRIDSSVFLMHRAGVWTDAAWPVAAVAVGGDIVLSGRKPAVASPTGGTTVDIEARTAIASILDRMRAHGLIEI